MSAGTWRSSPLPPDWPRIRTRVLARDGDRCRLRLPGCKGRATEVHHVGDPNDHSDANLLSSCHDCHQTETGRANAKRIRRAPRRRVPEPHPGAVGRG